MPFLLGLVRSSVARSENLDQHMVAAKTESGRLRRHARSGAPKLMGEDGAAGRGDGLRRGDESIDAAAVEPRQPARLHEGASPI